MKKTVATFSEAKKKGQKLTMLTAYDYWSAKLTDGCDIDGILVGDSLGMVCLGYKDTLAVTMDDMLHHTKAVVRGVTESLVVADMPFLSYQISVEDAIRNAGRLIQEGGAEAVKLEGGADVSDRVKSLVKAQIPVMGHLGLTPQSVHLFGGFKVQGKEEVAAKRLLEDAKILEDAGAFAIVLECIPVQLANRISHEISIPTIGIGAGVHCDGQILVLQDMLGLSDFSPKFVKRFGDLGERFREGVCRYVEEVKSGTFPDETTSYIG